MVAGRSTGDPPWPPPRGGRDPVTGEWKWPLWGRPDDSYGFPLERQAVASFRRLADTITNTRYEKGLSVRHLAAAAGVAVSTTSSFESGSAWGRWATLLALAAPLGLTTEAGDGSTDVVGALVAKMKRPRGESRREVAFRASLRPNTVYDLGRPGVSPSVATVLAVAVVTRTEVQLVAPSGVPGDS